MQYNLTTHGLLTSEHSREEMMTDLSGSTNTNSENQQSAVATCAVDDNYDKFVENLAKNHVAQVFTNQSSSHALSILRNVFKYADKEVNIFSGTLDSCVYNDKELISAAENFLKTKHGIVRVLLQGDVAHSRKDVENDFLHVILSLGGDIKLAQDDNPLKNVDNHFLVADSKAYRVELDVNERSAVCNFNDESLGTQLKNVFNSSWESKVIPLSLTAQSA